MTGEQLYEIWHSAMADRGVEADVWEDIGDDEKESWQEVALVVGESA